jgi:hypothetical protein
MSEGTPEGIYRLALALDDGQPLWLVSQEPGASTGMALAGGEIYQTTRSQGSTLQLVDTSSGLLLSDVQLSEGDVYIMDTSVSEDAIVMAGFGLDAPEVLGSTPVKAVHRLSNSVHRRQKAWQGLEKDDRTPTVITREMTSATLNGWTEV